MKPTPPLPLPFSRPVSLFPAEVACRPPTLQTRSGAVPGSVSAPGLAASVPCCCCVTLPRRPPRAPCGFGSAPWAQGQVGAGVGLKESESSCALPEGRSGRRRERCWPGVCDQRIPSRHHRHHRHHSGLSGRATEPADHERDAGRDRGSDQPRSADGV